jgi:pimeloyl-ACP methyl ester carboxylesterase
MQKIFFQCILILLVFAAPAHAQSSSYGNNKAAGNYLQVNGIKLYYEIYGAGQPLLLLHGNGGSIAGRSDFIEGFAKSYKVIALDSRCHGNSGCDGSELSYDRMAADVNALLEHLQIDSALVYGHSDGAIVGLIMAMRYPRKIKKLVASGANMVADSTAIFPQILALINMYPMVPDTLMKKRLKLMATYPKIAMADLQKISIPVLITAGDRDAVREEHTLKIFQSIPNSNLFILPGTTHFGPTEKFNLFYEVASGFFANPFEKPSTIQMMQEKARSLMRAGK